MRRGLFLYLTNLEYLVIIYNFLYKLTVSTPQSISQQQVSLHKGSHFLFSIQYCSLPEDEWSCPFPASYFYVFSHWLLTDLPQNSVSISIPLFGLKVNIHYNNIADNQEKLFFQIWP